MPRNHFQPNEELPYHVSARCINKEWFQIPLEEVWVIFSNYLFFIHHAFGVRIHSFVLMSNHFHLIIHTPNANLDKAMNYFMRESSRAIGKRAGRINQVFGGPYAWSILRTPNYYLHAYKYVYRNPVEAGMVKKAELFEYSTLYYLLGTGHSWIPLVNDQGLFEDPPGHLSWLNESYSDAKVKLDIRNALRRNEFQFGRDKKSKKNSLDFLLS